MNQETSSLQIFFFKHHHKSPVFIYIYIYTYNSNSRKIYPKFDRNFGNFDNLFRIKIYRNYENLVQTSHHSCIHFSERRKFQSCGKLTRQGCKKGEHEKRKKILFLRSAGGRGERQVQSPSPADIISVNVARVYPHTYLTNSPLSRAGLQRLDRRRLDRVT